MMPLLETLEPKEPLAAVHMQLAIPLPGPLAAVNEL